MTTERRTFLGLTIEGDINEADKRVPQRPIEDLQPIMQAVLDDPTVVEFGWHQYTPLFNDGDPCVFSTSDAWLRTDTDDPNAETYNLEICYSHPSLGKMTGGEWVPVPEEPHRRTLVGEHYEGPDQARYERAAALNDAIAGGAFNDVVIDAFGDNARITVRKDGIEVEYYDPS